VPCDRLQGFKGQATHANLKQAFAAEAGDVARYLYFAKIADIEGFPDLAQLFRDLAESTACSAHGHLDFLKQVGDPDTDLTIGETDSNLLAAIASTCREQNELYPRLAQTAHEEGFADIANWFETLATSKKFHAEKLAKALAWLTDYLREEA